MSLHRTQTMPNMEWSNMMACPGRLERVPRSMLAHPGTCKCHCALDIRTMFPLRSIENPEWTREKRYVPVPRCLLHELVEELPVRYRSNRWIDAFDTHQDGFSINHLYRRMQDHPGAGVGLFLVEPIAPGTPSTRRPELRTGGSAPGSPQQAATPRFGFRGTDPTGVSCGPPARGLSVIGVFVGELPTMNHGAHHFFGGRETFVFRINFPTGGPLTSPVSDCSESESSDNNEEKEHAVEIFRWSGGNEDFMVCSHDFIGIGGGAAGAAIYLSGDLQSGTTSNKCTTFGSPILCGNPLPGMRQAEFNIVQMMWFHVESSFAELSLLAHPMPASPEEDEEEKEKEKEHELKPKRTLSFHSIPKRGITTLTPEQYDSLMTERCPIKAAHHNCLFIEDFHFATK